MGYRTFLIGRSDECEIKLDDPRVSRFHAELVIADSDKAHLTDRRSTGGTEVLRNGAWSRIERQEMLSLEDRLRFAGAVERSVRELMDSARRR